MLHGKQFVKRQVFTLGLCLRLTVGTDEAGYFQFSKRQHLITTNSPSSTLTISCTFFCSLSLLASLSLPLPHSRNGSVSLSQILSLSLSLAHSLSIAVASSVASPFNFFSSSNSVVSPTEGEASDSSKKIYRVNFCFKRFDHFRQIQPKVAERYKNVTSNFFLHQEKSDIFSPLEKNLLSKAAVVQFRVFFLIASFEVTFLPDSKIQFSSQSWRIEDRNSKKKFWQVIESNFKFVVAWNKLWLASLWPRLGGIVPQ